MHTLFDFVTHVKGVEYVLAILFVGGFIVFWEFLNPRHFGLILKAGSDDLKFAREAGWRPLLTSTLKLVLAPLVGLLYVILLPVGFMLAAGSLLMGGVFQLMGRSTSFGWRPMESYLSGRRGKQKARKDQRPTDPDIQ